LQIILASFHLQANKSRAVFSAEQADQFLAEIQQLRTVVSAVPNILAFSDIEFKVMSIGID